MGEQIWTADQVEVHIRGLFTTRHDFAAGEVSLGEMTVSPWKRQFTFRGSDGTGLRLVRHGFWKVSWELWAGEQLRGQARPLGTLRRQMQVEFDGQTCLLRPAGFWGHTWFLDDPSGQPLLRIQPRGFLRRGAVLTILAEVELPLLVLAYTLVWQSWEAQAATAAAAS